MNYHHLSIEERSCIRKYYVDGLRCREIARLLGRDVSTISREIRRNMFAHPDCCSDNFAWRRVCHASPLWDRKCLRR